MNTDLNDADLVQAERRAKRFWVSFVVFFLGLQVVIGVASIRLATGDASVAIVPDYHKTALNWDSERIKQTAADRLGLAIDVKASDVTDASGKRSVLVSIHNRSGEPVSELTVAAKIYHHATANSVMTIPMRVSGPGEYFAEVPMGRDGLWQIDLSIEGAEEPISKPTTIEVAAVPSSLTANRG